MHFDVALLTPPAHCPAMSDMSQPAAASAISAPPLACSVEVPDEALVTFPINAPYKVTTASDVHEEQPTVDSAPPTTYVTLFLSLTSRL